MGQPGQAGGAHHYSPGRAPRQGDPHRHQGPSAHSSANRDEDVFEDPFAFDIRRSPNNHIAFGFGTHVCLGKALARLELSIMFERLLDRLPDVGLVNPSPPRSRASNFISGYDDSMTIRFTPGTPVGS